MRDGFDEVARTLRQGVEAGHFPGAVLVVGYQGTVVYEDAVGHAALAPSRRRMTLDTIFDLASLTKPMATATALMLLIDTGEVRLDDPVDTLLDTWCRPACDTPSLRQLLSHSSGLPAWRPYYRHIDRALAPPDRRRAVYDAVHREPLTAPPGAMVQYSDVGFILLGEVIETVAGRSLDRFCRQEIFGPLRLGDIAFRNLERPQPPDAPVASTEGCPWRGCIMAGEVHDENAWIMGGVAGHAGLFGTGRQVWRFAQGLLEGLKGGAWLASPPTVRAFTARQGTPDGSTWALGWDTPSPAKSSAGRYFSPAAVGHLGFTGTSLWIDPSTEVIVVLLTNRVHPSRQRQGIRIFRPLIHDAIMRALLGGPVQHSRLRVKPMPYGGDSRGEGRSPSA
jgi:serine-type D-Ala-D-Ala carboxypeptidase